MRPLRARGARGARRPRIALRSLQTLRPYISLRPLRALRSRVALRSLRALRAHIPLGPLRAFGAWIALRPLRASRARGTLLAAAARGRPEGGDRQPDADKCPVQPFRSTKPMLDSHFDPL